MEYEDSSDSSPEGGAELETAEILGQKIEIPKGIAEHLDIFNEVISADTWRSLSQADQQHLWQFLPTFAENDNIERGKTLSMLFNRENFKFGSPFNAFHEKLQRGYFRPDIAQMLRMVKKSERRQLKEQRRKAVYKMLKTVLISRREYLQRAHNASPWPPKLPPLSDGATVASQSATNGNAVHQRVNKRYLQELAAVRSEVGEFSQSSEDESYERGTQLSKKQRHKLAMLDNSLSTTDMKPVTSTLATKPYGFDLETRVSSVSNPFEITEEVFRKMVSTHRRKRAVRYRRAPPQRMPQRDPERVQATHRRSSVKSAPDGTLEKHKRRQSSTCSTPVPRPKPEPVPDIDHLFAQNVKKEPEIEQDSTKKSEESTDEEVQRVLDRSIEGDKTIDVESASPTNIPQNQKLMENQTQQAAFKMQSQSLMRILPVVQQKTVVAVPQKVVASPALSTVKEEDLKLLNELTDLLQENYVCFFSLLRDIICSSPQQRMRCDVIEARLKAWETNPLSPLNEWFSLVDEPWSNLLESALKFLSGEYPVELQPEDYVPYIELKASTRSFQWIGAGRDSDSHLLALCSHWLDHRDEITMPNCDPELEEVDMDVAEEGEDTADDTVPPPRCPTNWTVCASTPDEKTEFHRQERLRFENPMRAFTYHMHGYDSVVGPVKGIYTSQSSVLKPRGHNLLCHNRPNYVTVLALVRDAAARLPNGEGTRSDMCTLIRDSQYLIDASETILQGVVSGALDRLHYEVDACVRFDTRRKIWIYLHRRRSEAEMEKIHQQYQGVAKTMKKPAKKKVKKPDGKELAEKTARRPKAPIVRAPKVTAKEEGEVTFGDLEGAEIADSTVHLEQELLSAVAAKKLPNLQTSGPSSDRNFLTASAAVKSLDASLGSITPSIARVVPPGESLIKQLVPSVARVTLPDSTTKPVTPPVTRMTSLPESLIKQMTPPVTRVTSLPEGLLRSAQVASSMMRPGNPPTSEGLLKVSVSGSAVSTPLLVNNLAGTQFVTSTGQKVQIIAGVPQNIGQLQSIQLNSGQNILSQSLQATAAGGGVIQNLQQLQFLTSSGQIISRVVQPTKPGGEKTSVLKNASQRSASPNPAGLQKGLRATVPSSTESRPGISLLTNNQVRPVTEKEGEKVKLSNIAGLQMLSKSGGKLGAQIINVSGVHLLNKPMLSKTNASLLTGVKLVNTHQGVKMVATSATTVVQTTLPSPKVTSTMAKALSSTPISSSATFTQNVQRTSPQIISMDALVHGARANVTANKGQASLIQIPSGSNRVAQFAVLGPQGSLQPRIIQAHQRGTAPVQQGKSNLRMALAGIKPVILAKPQQQTQNVVLTTDGSSSGQLGQALVLSPQTGVRSATPGATPGAVTVMHPSGTHQILLPTNFNASSLNFKNMSGLQLVRVPISAAGQKVYTRFVKAPATTMQQQQPSTSADVPKSEEPK